MAQMKILRSPKIGDIKNLNEFSKVKNKWGTLTEEIITNILK
jgi:hypothetical protein